jgi:ornithine cyclodeaminase/alanine dehydrogenase
LKLYLSEHDVTALAITPGDAVSIVERALVAAGEPRAGARTIMPGSQPDASFQTTIGIAAGHAVAGLKWISVAGGSGDPAGRARVGGLVIVNDYESGALTGVVDAAAVIALRTAAETVIAARRLARPDSRRIGFVACGRQALMHLDALRMAFPLARVHAYSARGFGAARLAEAARARGLEAARVQSPREAVEGMDLVVSSVPFAPDAEPLADSRWMAAGAFVAFLDFGRRWQFTEPFDVIATDDVTLLCELAAAGRATLPDSDPVDVKALLTAEATGRSSPRQRTAFMQCGLVAGDLALAHVALERARTCGTGTRLG